MESGIQWWEELTEKGGEGMVVKPLEFVAKGQKGLIQPGVKCRGPEYLRIIYGPEYTLPGNLERLRSRGLSAKRSLALREFALGIEGLERFVRQEPLRRVHECVFGVLALESEPVDPRLQFMPSSTTGEAPQLSIRRCSIVDEDLAGHRS
jgi:PNKP (polynucleotide 5'-kinase/3'-phosphatase) family adenylyltransferase-like protein